MAACIDSGYKDATVLRFTRDRYNRRVFATKGRSGEGTIWPHKPSRKNQTPFFMIGVNAAKDAVYDRVKVKEPGPGYCHFPLGRDLEYFEQLTAEKKYVRYHNGFPKYEWRKTGRRAQRGARLPRVCLRRAQVAGSLGRAVESVLRALWETYPATARAAAGRQSSGRAGRPPGQRAGGAAL